MALGRFASRIGIGLAAGFVGTAVVTLVQLAEQRLKGEQEESTVPAKAVEKVFRIRPEDAAAERQLAMLAHWGYGTVWGVFRSLLDSLGIRGKAATTLHTLAIQIAAMILLPGLKVAPPLKEWGAGAIGAETGLHALYAAAVGTTYNFLSRDLRPARRGRIGRAIGRLAA